MTIPTLSPPRISAWGQLWRLLLAGGLSFLTFVVTLVERLQIQDDGTAANGSDAMFLLTVADVLAGVVCFGIVLLRRRWPLAVALVTTAVAAFSSVAAGPAVLALVSVATRRRWPEIAVLAVPNIVSIAVFERLGQTDPLPWFVLVGFGVVLYAAMVGAGMYIGARRDLFATLQWRAETAEREQLARAEQAQVAERNRIAREMHDVLAHRISVVTMYAGALAARDDLTDAERKDSARVIEENSRAALTDLRQVLGVLRQPSTDGGAAVEPPQPTLLGLEHLVGDARDLGDDITLDVATGLKPELARLPEATSRAAYRMIQEGLTNSRKHAPGAPVTVRLEGAPGQHLLLDLRNGPPPAGTGDVPGAGLGLVGLRERAELLGGELDSRHLPDGGFVLRARLPWST